MGVATQILYSWNRIKKKKVPVLIIISFCNYIEIRTKQKRGKKKRPLKGGMRLFLSRTG